MRCYYHPSNEAVALCKSCSRALCRECASDVPPGTACRNRCEEDVESLNLMIRRGRQVYAKTGKAYRRNGLILLVMGALFLVTGLLPVFLRNDYGAVFLAVTGALFVVWSFFSFKSGRQIEQADDDANQVPR